MNLNPNLWTIGLVNLQLASALEKKLSLSGTALINVASEKPITKDEKRKQDNKHLSQTANISK